MKNLFIILIIISFNYSFAQCPVNNAVFQAGEKITMEISYNWGFIWVNAGTVYFKTDTSNIFGQKTFHFKSFGRSYDSWDWFMKVRDLYESYSTTENLKSVYYFRKVLEGSKMIHNKYRFDYTKKLIYSDLYYSDEGGGKDTIELKNCTFDPLTAIYYARSIDFSKAAIDQKFPLRIMIDNEIHELYIRYLGKEKIEDRNKQEYNCIKFSAKMVEGTIFSGGEDITVWVTDDENKIPVIVDAKIVVGSIKAYLQKAEGLRNPFSAKIKSSE